MNKIPMPCPRCARHHHGVCGIPPGVTRGYGARLSGNGPELHGRPTTKPPSVSALVGLLAQAEKHYKKVMELLKQIPPQMPEYADLLDREGKLAQLIKQLHQQIGERKAK